MRYAAILYEGTFCKLRFAPESGGAQSDIIATRLRDLHPHSMDTLAQIRKILRDSLNLGERAERLTADSALLGGIPEFDSMAVVNLVTAIEAEFDVTVNDDELSAEVFATVGTLTRFVSDKLAQ